MYDYLIVGAGLAGCTVAERLASQLGATVLLVDRREHLAGNAYDPIDRDGLQYHQYGPHIFHTNSMSVVDYLSQFTQWRPYEHRVLARVNGTLVPIPINRTTLSAIVGAPLDDAGAAALLAARAEPVARIVNSEQMVRSRVGRELYELFFRGYTRKQWGIDPAELDATVCGRIPTRTSSDDRYFSDAFQAMPAAGFGAMAERMVRHPKIEIALGSSYREIVDRAHFRHLIFTGPIDEYFEHRYGALPYRSLRFEFETHCRAFVQDVAVINEPDERVPYTRTTEYKHLTGQVHAKTILSREFPSANGDPYYPIPRPENRELYRKYALLADEEAHVSFVGRLAQYQYLNMDQVVASALVTFEAIARRSAA